MNILRRWMLSRAPFYRRFPAQDWEIAAAVNMRTVVDRRRGFIYFRIPKAANSTVMVNLSGMDTKGMTRAKDAKRLFDRVDTLTRREVDSLEALFYLFTVVRNPYTRLASSFLDRIARGKSPHVQVVCDALGVSRHEDIRFHDFCRYLEAGGLDQDPHWYPQVDFIPCGADKLDFVGHVETLDADLNQIMTRIGGAAPAGLLSWSPHATGASGKLSQLYCDESARIVARLYERDFSAFGYSTRRTW